MQNSISSAEQAISALKSLKRTSSLVRANLGFPGVAFSMVGRVVRLEADAFELWSKDGCFIVKSLSDFELIGQLDESTVVIDFSLTLTPRHKGPDGEPPFRFFLCLERPAAQHGLSGSVH